VIADSLKVAPEFNEVAAKNRPVARIIMMSGSKSGILDSVDGDSLLPDTDIFSDSTRYEK